MNLIVGGTGFVGGHLAEYFFQQGEISKAIFRRGDYLRILDQCGVQNYEGDISDPSTLHEPLEGVDTIYDLTSDASSVPGQGADGLRNLLREAEEHGVKTIVRLSSLCVYGSPAGGRVETGSTPRPSSPGQRAMLESDSVLLEFAKNNPWLKVRVVRAALTTGARDPAFALPILAMAERGTILLPPGGEGRMSFSHPRDVAQAMQKSAAGDAQDSVHLVKSFDASASEVAERVAAACGKDVRIRRQGLLGGRSAVQGHAAEMIKGGLSVGEQESWKRIGYAPSYSVETVATEVAEWYRKEPRLAGTSRR